MENRIYPRHGTGADLFERLSEYISYFDKDWTKNIEGATDEEIEKLESLGKFVDKDFKLPDYLYSFLKIMGKKSDGYICPFDNIIDSMLICNETYFINLYLNNRKKVNRILFEDTSLGDSRRIIDLTENGKIYSVCISEVEDMVYEPNGILKYLIEERYDEVFENFIKDKEYFLEEYAYWKRRVEILKEDEEYEQFKNEQIKNNFMTEEPFSVENISSNFENELFQTAFVKYERFNNYIKIEILDEINMKEKGRRENIEKMLESYGLKKPWFADGIGCDSGCYKGYKDGLTVCLAFSAWIRGDGVEGGLLGFITGEDKELVEEIHAKILKYIE